MLKNITLLLFLFLFFLKSMGQDHKVIIELEVNNKAVALSDNFSVTYHEGDSTKEARIIGDCFMIPDDAIKNGKINFNLKYKRYCLPFDSIPIREDLREHKWKVLVDKKPFDKEQYWTIKDWKGVYLIYQLYNDSGTVMTISKTR